ncbi:MAG: hypothetical protein ACI4UY_04260 [Kiritimatiellia bacterium]
MNLARNLVDWYAKAKRPMPWRLAPSHYICWLSEIMMQQTTYAAVLPYFNRGNCKTSVYRGREVA